MITKTLFYLDFYIEKIEILHVFTNKWRSFDIINFSNFFLSVLEETKNCIYREETANVGMRL